MDTVISLIPDDEHVVAARRKLEVAGFAGSQVKLLSRPAEVWQRLGGRQKIRRVARKAALGAWVGLIVGALYGILAGLLNCRFMNCTPETGLVLWVLISLFWLVGGGLVGTIIGLDELERDLYAYVEGVRRGETLFMIGTAPKMVPEARRILQQACGTVIHDLHEDAETK